MAASDRDRDAAKFGIRDWDQIALAWGEYLPLAEEIVWPEEEVEDLPQLRPIYQFLRESKQGELQELENVEFLYPETFMASLAYTRRAAHVLRASAKHTEVGFRSWSRASAYQAAFFGMQSILRLLGAVILFNRERKETFQIDIWSAGTIPKSNVQTASDSFTVRGYRRTSRSLQHLEFWSVFSRLIRSTKMPPQIWPYVVADRYKRISGDDFGSLRNDIHYRASNWPFDDLISQLPAEDINDFCKRSAESSWTDAPGHGDFPLFLGLQVVVMAVSLFQSILPNGTMLRAEIDAREEDLRSINVHRHVTLGAT